jgi:hypothetical protein
MVAKGVGGEKDNPTRIYRDKADEIEIHKL